MYLSHHYVYAYISIKILISVNEEILNCVTNGVNEIMIKKNESIVTLVVSYNDT